VVNNERLVVHAGFVCGRPVPTPKSSKYTSEMIAQIKEDIQTAFARDPAARTAWEVICCYPGLHAIWFHRLAQRLWRRRLKFFGRLMSHIARLLTGVDIHPGATIGRRFFIDHGMGVVIGETTEIGDDVLVYQGAVLGGTTTRKGKRHPTIGNDVVIGAGATLLGAITVGHGARIGAGSVVIKPVPGGATVVGVPAHIAGAEDSDPERNHLGHDKLPDPVLRTLSELQQRQGILEERIRELERSQASADTVAERSLATAVENSEASVRQTLQRVLDPEAGINVVDLGMIKKINVNGGRVEVQMVLTSPSCPSANYLVEQVRRATVGLPQVDYAEVTILDEPWSWERYRAHKAV